MVIKPNIGESDLRYKAEQELVAEETRRQIDTIKQELRQKRQTLLYRIWYALRYKKPVIKWEYR